jgi:uncharacterized membrane protein
MKMSKLLEEITIWAVMLTTIAAVTYAVSRVISYIGVIN